MKERLRRFLNLGPPRRPPPTPGVPASVGDRFRDPDPARAEALEVARRAAGEALAREVGRRERARLDGEGWLARLKSMLGGEE